MSYAETNSNVVQTYRNRKLTTVKDSPNTFTGGRLEIGILMNDSTWALALRGEAGVSAQRRPTKRLHDVRVHLSRKLNSNQCVDCLT